MNMNTQPEHPQTTSFFPAISKQQILAHFHSQRSPINSFQSLLEQIPELFSKSPLEPENFLQKKPFTASEILAEPTPTSTPKVLRLVPQKKTYIPKSPFTTSGYVDDDTLRAWYYLDEANNVQGPFTSLEMDHWFDNGLLFNELLIRIRENNNFVPLFQLFGKTEVVYVQKYVPAGMAEQLSAQKLMDQAASKSSEIKRGVLSSSKSVAKESIYSFDFVVENNNPSSSNHLGSPLKSPELLIKSPGKQEVKAKDSPKPMMERSKDQSSSKEVKELVVTEKPVQVQVQEKEQEQRKEEELKKENPTTITTQEDKQKSDTENIENNEVEERDSFKEREDERKEQQEKKAEGKNNNNNNRRKPYEQVEYVVKKSRKEEERAVNSSNKGIEIQYVPKQEKQEHYGGPKHHSDKGGATNYSSQSTKGQKPGGKGNNNKGQKDFLHPDSATKVQKGGQDMIVFIPKKKQDHSKASEDNKLPEAVVYDRRDSETFEMLKATSEYFKADDDKGPRSDPGDQAVIRSPRAIEEREEVDMPILAAFKKPRVPKERLKLFQRIQDDYEEEQERVVSTSLGLLDLEDEQTTTPSKKGPTKSSFKSNSATPSPLIIDGITGGGGFYDFPVDEHHYFNHYGSTDVKK